MKVCAIQIPYAQDARDAESSVNFLIRELESCDGSLDLILTPEYSNTPAEFPEGENLRFAEAHTARLVETARAAASAALSFSALRAAGMSPGISLISSALAADQPLKPTGLQGLCPRTAAAAWEAQVSRPSRLTSLV